MSEKPMTALYRGWLELLGRAPKAVYIKDCAGEFAAMREVKSLARRLGYSIGPIDTDVSEGDAFPVALYKGAKRVGKWCSLDSESRGRMGGILVSDDFREGPVAMVEFQEAEDG